MSDYRRTRLANDARMLAKAGLIGAAVIAVFSVILAAFRTFAMTSWPLYDPTRGAARGLALLRQFTSFFGGALRSGLTNAFMIAGAAVVLLLVVDLVAAQVAPPWAPRLDAVFRRRALTFAAVMGYLAWIALAAGLVSAAANAVNALSLGLAAPGPPSPTPSLNWALVVSMPLSQVITAVRQFFLIAFAALMIKVLIAISHDTQLDGDTREKLQ